MGLPGKQPAPKRDFHPFEEPTLSPSSLHLYVDAGFASPYAMSVFVALHEKALPFELGTIDLAANENHGPQYAAISLTRRVPALVHNGSSISESSAITEYLDEVFPGMPLYPADSYLRARARQVQAWLRSDLMPIRQERSTEVVFCKPTQTPLSIEARAAAEKLFHAAEALLPENSENLFGEWSIADVDLALMLNRLVLNGDYVPKRLAAYARHQWRRSSVQLWLKQPRPGQ